MYNASGFGAFGFTHVGVDAGMVGVVDVDGSEMAHAGGWVGGHGGLGCGDIYGSRVCDDRLCMNYGCTCTHMYMYPYGWSSRRCASAVWASPKPGAKFEREISVTIRGHVDEKSRRVVTGLYFWLVVTRPPLAENDGTIIAANGGLVTKNRKQMATKSGALARI